MEPSSSSTGDFSLAPMAPHQKGTLPAQCTYSLQASGEH